MKHLTVMTVSFVVASLLAVAPAAAQGVQTGSLVGTVVDNEAKPLPGVTVTVSGPTLQGTKSAVTDEKGEFRFPTLPPGEQYELVLELEGFRTEERSGIPVRVGTTTMSPRCR